VEYVVIGHAGGRNVLDEIRLDAYGAQRLAKRHWNVGDVVDVEDLHEGASLFW
jgi:hypothetical protein